MHVFATRAVLEKLFLITSLSPTSVRSSLCWGLWDLFLEEMSPGTCTGSFTVKQTISADISHASVLED